MEIASGIHMIQGTVGKRPLQLFLLNGATRRVLLDSGCSGDPERIVFPYLERIGVSPDKLDMVINTHPDLDHTGGNAALKRANPTLLVTCGDDDRELIESPEDMWRLRYNAYSEPHGIAYPEDARRWIFQMMGPAQPVDFTWSGGEMLRLAPDWLVEIHRVPGHSRGHLAVFEPRSGTALTGDAVQGAVYLDLEGKAALCPTYLYVDAYRASIRYLRALRPKALAACHWSVKRGAEVEAFLDETAEFVDTAERAVLEYLHSAKGGATLREVIDAAGPRLGDWPRSIDIELMYALNGHLEQLAATGRIRADETVRPIRYYATRA